MKKVISVFNREAIGIYNTIVIAMEVQVVDIIDKTTGEFSNEKTKSFTLKFINSINKKSINLNAIYSTIENSDNPECFFDEISFKEIKKIEVIVNLFIKKLLYQYNEIISMKDVHSEAIETLIRIRRTAAKLRNSIKNIISLYHQLEVETRASYKAELELKPETVTILKNATKIIVNS
ncbi:hypothetical protein [Vibrio chagasii]|uniref:hypothetical protein n=1 Tax=Vibrio chagasii TaxID=170679 RepID=UPI003DA04FAA